jgi:tRNA pseudouridine38-40 synthase
MTRVKLIISYDGTDYCGWQKQKSHAFASDLPTIQETAEKALEKIFRHPISLSASGRTDAGVHAAAQVIHFDTDRRLPKDLCWALRSHLPDTIVAKAAFIAPDDFHSTISAEKKTYRYWVWNNPRPTALMARYSWWIRQELDVDFLNECAKHLISKQDFASFRSVGTEVKHTIRHIYKAQWRRKKSGLLQFEVTGNGFMKQMVRNLVGTQVDLALRGEPSERMLSILQAKDRTKAGPAAPPQGLFLAQVYYPKELDNRCRQI